MANAADPTRIAAQIVTGIGFLGAGVILREGVNVHGLNTAATLWCSAMVGTIVGEGFWAAGGVAAGFVVAPTCVCAPWCGWSIAVRYYPPTPKPIIR